MAYYSFRCRTHEVIRWFTMGAAPQFIDCDEHLERAFRNYDCQIAPQDTTRFFHNPTLDSRYSFALGQEMPGSKQELHRLYDEKGIEPVTRGTMPQAWKDDLAYKEHVDHGGEREAPPAPNISGGAKVAELLRQKGTL